MSAGATIDLPCIGVRYAGFRLEVPAASVPWGTVLGVFGHSGSGKTSYATKLFERLGPKRSVFLPQQDSLLEDITGEQNVRLAADPSLSAAQLGHLIKKFAEALDLDDRLESFGWRLSGGERRRILLMRTFASAGSVLILDEPFVGLGWRDEVRAREFVRNQRSRFGAIIIISHSADLLWSLADRVWVMNEGRRVAEIEPSQEDAAQTMDLELADSLGLTNILSFAELRCLLRDVSVPQWVEEWGGLLGCWLADAQLGAKPEDRWALHGRVDEARVAFHRYVVQGRRIVELRAVENESTSPLIVRDTGGHPDELWVAIRRLYRVAR